MTEKNDDNETTRSLSINLNADGEATRGSGTDARYKGFFGGWRLLKDKTVHGIRKWWNHYLQNVVPANDDEVPDGWPKIFSGTLGRWLLAGCTVIALGVWLLILFLVWSR